jgi:hypothetical protein
MGVHLMGMHLIGMHSTGMYLLGVHFMGVYFTGVGLADIYLMGMHLYPYGHASLVAEAINSRSCLRLQSACRICLPRVIPVYRDRLAMSAFDISHFR